MRILIIKPSSLGDILHGLQVATQLRVAHPGVEISWVVQHNFAHIVHACTAVNGQVFIFHRRGGVRAFFKLLKQLKQAQPFDWVLDMQGLLRSALMLRAARVKTKAHKAGRADSREGARFFYPTKPQLPETKPAHAVDILKQFLPLLGHPATIETPLAFHLKDDQITANIHPYLNKQPILLFPETSRAEKNWPQFTTFAGKYAAHLNNSNNTETPNAHPLLWLGTGNLQPPKAENITNVSGKTSLLDVIALVQNAKLVVCGDSGPLHLAAAMGTPTLSIFTTTNPQQYGPYPVGHSKHSAQHTVLQNPSVTHALKAIKEL